MYKGDWLNGRMDGTGTYEWNSNPADYDRLVMRSCDRYTGQWSGSKRHGKNGEGTCGENIRLGMKGIGTENTGQEKF